MALIRQFKYHSRTYSVSTQACEKSNNRIRLGEGLLAEGVFVKGVFFEKVLWAQGVFSKGDFAKGVSGKVFSKRCFGGQPLTGTFVKNRYVVEQLKMHLEIC